MPETAELNRAAAVKGITGSFRGILRINGRETPLFYAFFTETGAFPVFFCKKELTNFISWE